MIFFQNLGIETAGFDLGEQFLFVFVFFVNLAIDALDALNKSAKLIVVSVAHATLANSP